VAATADEAATTGDEAATTGDEAAKTGDEAATTGDEAAKTGDEAATTGDEAATTGDEAATTGVEAATTSDEAAATGELDTRVEVEEAAPQVVKTETVLPPKVPLLHWLLGKGTEMLAPVQSVVPYSMKTIVVWSQLEIW